MCKFICNVCRVNSYRSSICLSLAFASRAWPITLAESRLTVRATSKNTIKVIVSAGAAAKVS